MIALFSKDILDSGSYCIGNRWRIILVFLFMVCVAWGFSMNIGDAPLVVRNFQHGNGLVDAHINCIMIDTDGFAWLGTTSDVQRFDGIQNRRYAFSPEFGGSVNALFQNSAGKILVATDMGIGELQHRDRSIVRIHPEVQSRVVDIGEHDGDLLLVTDAGVCKVSPDGSISKIDDATDCIALKKGDDGEYYLLRKDGVGLICGDKVKDYGNGSIGSGFTAMTDMGQCLLIGTEDKGLYTFDKKTKCFSHYKDVGNNRITALAANQDIVTVGTRGTGLFIFSRNNPEDMVSIEYRPDRDGVHLAFNYIKFLMADNLNIIWIGYDRNVGFDYIQFNNKAFSVFSKDKAIPCDIEYSRVYVDGTVKLFATINGLYSITNGDKVSFHPLGAINGVASCDVTSYLPFGDWVLIGTTAGLYRYSPSDDTLLPMDDWGPLGNTRINMMSIDHKGETLLATGKGLFVIKADGTRERYTADNFGLSSDSVEYVFTDSQGTVWISTGGTVMQFDSVRGAVIPAPAPFRELSRVTFIGEDHKGRMLIIKDRKSAFQIEKSGKDRRAICTMEDAGFLGLFIEKVLQDSDYNYWFVGSRGVVKGNPSLTDYTLFSSTEGFIEPYSNDGQIYNDTLWITTPKGVLFTETDATLQSPPTRITDVVVNGESCFGEYMEALEKNEILLLPENATNVAFEFATLSYDFPDRMIYEYKLEGYDDKWNILRGINSVSFRNLPPGAYRFVVRKQMDNSSIQEIPFRIGSKTRYLALAGVIAICLLLLVGLLFYIRYRRRKHTLALPVDLSSIPTSIDGMPACVATDGAEEGRETMVAENDLSGEPVSSARETEKYRFNKLKDETAETVASNLKEYMDTERPYLNPDLKLVNVAEAIEVSPQVLSQVLNTALNIRFNDYVNQLRIDRFKDCITTYDSSKYTLQSLARECGFSSYSTFFRAFKELTGQTPNDYIKGLQLRNR